ncbi:MAG: HPr-rel-A system PqqD family peptide chaperone [Sphingorhabdus sp.]
MPSQSILYQAEPADQRLIEPLDVITLIYQRRSGITHMVAEPVPEILASMGDAAMDAANVLERLSAQFDLGDADDAIAVVSARLEELADLGLVDRVTRDV